MRARSSIELQAYSRDHLVAGRLSPRKRPHGPHGLRFGRLGSISVFNPAEGANYFAFFFAVFFFAVFFAFFAFFAAIFVSPFLGFSFDLLLSWALAFAAADVFEEATLLFFVLAFAFLLLLAFAFLGG